MTRGVRVAREVAGHVKARVGTTVGAAKETEEGAAGGAHVLRTAAPIARTATAKMMAAGTRSN